MRWFIAERNRRRVAYVLCIYYTLLYQSVDRFLICAGTVNRIRSRGGGKLEHHEYIERLLRHLRFSVKHRLYLKALSVLKDGEMRLEEVSRSD